MSTHPVKHSTRHMALASMCLALAYVLPLLTGQIQQIGSMLLPMHLAIFLCAYITDHKWAALVGLIAPITRSLIFGMPPMFPTAVGMAIELATYGFVAGLLNEKLSLKTGNIYVSLIAAMIIGRIVWGLASILLYGAAGKTFTWPIFIASAFTKAIPGIILQLIAIPIIVMALRKAKIIDKGRQ